MDPLYMIIATTIAFLVGGGISWYCFRRRVVDNQEVSNTNIYKSMEEGEFPNFLSRGAAIDHSPLNEFTPAEIEPEAGMVV